ncbi:hypothetical protein H1R20_g7144, partial [Candolleomyces eurysporus]
MIKIKSCFELRVSLCDSCKYKQFKSVDDLLNMGYDEKAITPLPKYCVQGEWSYHLDTVATLAAEYKQQRGEKAKQVWWEEQERFWNDRMEHGLACRSARKLEHEKYEARRYEMLEKIREERVKRMNEKLTELGWEKEAERYLKTEPYKYVYKEKPLTDDEWAVIMPELTALMEIEREKLRKEEIGEHIKRRIDKWLKPAFTAFILSRPPNEINPNILEVALSDQWRTVLCTEPFSEDLTESSVQSAGSQIPEFAQSWRKDRIGQLLELVRKSKTYSGQEVTEDVLHLACTMFRCTNCKCGGPGEVNTYAHTLVHSCNFLWMYSPIVQVAPRDAKHLPPPELPDDGYSARKRPIIRLYREEERHILTTLEHVGIWVGLDPHIVFDDVAHEHMLSLLDTLGWSCDTTVAEMEERQPYVECFCECYHDPKKPLSRKIYRWKKAVSIII